MTAHVLIALEGAIDKLQGKYRLFANTARQKGLHFLEKMLPKVEDVYQLCIVSYTLALLRSSECNLAYKKLMGASLENDGKIYWSPTPITANR